MASISPASAASLSVLGATFSSFAALPRLSQVAERNAVAVKADLPCQANGCAPLVMDEYVTRQENAPDFQQVRDSAN